jgi:hypothetical protein
MAYINCYWQYKPHLAALVMYVFMYSMFNEGPSARLGKNAAFAVENESWTSHE